MYLLLVSFFEEIKLLNEVLLIFYDKKIKIFFKKFLCWKCDFNMLMGFLREVY